MNEARIVLVVFAALAVPLIAFPIVTVMTKTAPVAADVGLDGEVSAAFLACAGGADAATATSSAVGRLLPKGLSQKIVFEKLAASGFTCATDSDAATCFRTHAQGRCDEDWKVRVIFKDDGTLWSSRTERKNQCP